jgi:hypothetical protein
MKPDSPEGIRGLHKPISSNVDGIHVSERLPRMAKVMDKVTLVRSMHHTMKNHNSASYYAPQGISTRGRYSSACALDLFPAYGSVVDTLARLAEDAFCGLPTMQREMGRSLPASM